MDNLAAMDSTGPKTPQNDRHRGLGSLESTPRRNSVISNVKNSDIDEVDANGFDIKTSLDLRSNTAVESENESKEDNDEIRKAGQLAEMIVDTKRSFMADNNILDSNKVIDAYGTTIQEDPKMAHISRATLVRAEKVKATIGFKYMIIERSYDKYVAYPGIDGVYNPLQVIRNRKIRAKYKEYPKPLAAKTLPLASKLFSSHNVKGRKKPWKFPWAIELNELASDRAWRAHHIHELRNAKGELWYPPSSSSSLTSAKQKSLKHESKKKRMHDKLFNDDDIESGKSIRSSKSSSRAEDSRLLPLTESKKSKRDSIKSRVKKKLKSYTDTDTSSDSDSICSKHEEEGDHGKKTELSGNDPSPTIKEPSDQSLTLSKVTSSDTETPGLNNVQIKPIAKNKQNADNSEILDGDTSEINNGTYKEDDPIHIENEENSEEVEQKKQLNNQIIDIYNNLDYFNRANNLKLHFLINIYPDLTNSNIQKINQLVYSQIPHLNQSMIDINDDSIPSYELLCSTILNEIKSLIHILNDDYSLKIDNLLTSSDRLIGEINTSMSLELRKVDERLDKLNHSLFGPSFVNNAFTSQHSNNLQTLRPQNNFMVSDSGNYKILYFLLENTIVVSLRLIWMVVNIYKFGLWILLTIWKIIKFILF